MIKAAAISLSIHAFVLIVIGSGSIGYLLGSLNKETLEIDKEKIKTVYRYITVSDTIVEPVYQVKYVEGEKPNIDSLWQEAKNYWAEIYRDSVNVNYVASVDTTYKDSLFSASVSFISPIPLHPNSYFGFDFKVREKTIEKTKTILEKPGFFSNRFIFYVGVGINYHNEKITPGIQAGVGIRIN